MDTEELQKKGYIITEEVDSTEIYNSSGLLVGAIFGRNAIHFDITEIMCNPATSAR